MANANPGRAGFSKSEGKKRWQTIQDDDGQTAPGDGGNGETRDPGW